jgi:hypothetical protein
MLLGEKITDPTGETPRLHMGADEENIIEAASQ